MSIKMRSIITSAAVTFALGYGASASAVLSITSNGPYYATPSWDQQLTANRFVVLANWNSDAVLDRETGLVWQRSPWRSSMPWTAAGGAFARYWCLASTFGGRKGWRLPGVQELASLYEPNTGYDQEDSQPRLPLGHPFIDVLAARYWTGTTSVVDQTKAWTVAFWHLGSIAEISKTNTSDAYVWCVRGGQGPDMQ